MAKSVRLGNSEGRNPGCGSFWLRRNRDREGKKKKENVNRSALLWISNCVDLPFSFLFSQLFSTIHFSYRYG